MVKHLKHFLLAAGLMAFSALCVSCNQAPLINLDDYQVSVQMIDGTVLEDGTILTVPCVRVHVTHPEAASRIMQVNAYAFGERLDDAVVENKAGILALEFEKYEDRMLEADSETDVRITVVYGFDGSGGGPKTVYDQTLPMQFKVVD